MIPQHLATSGERYTPGNLVEFARSVLGEIDLDPASSRKANETVKAKKIYTVAQNGMTQKWAGRVFLNPPGSCPRDEKRYTQCGNAIVTPKGSRGRCSCKLPQRFWWKLNQAIESGDVPLAIWIGFQNNQLQSLQSLSLMSVNPGPTEFATLFLRDRVPYIDAETMQVMPQPPHASYVTLVARSERLDSAHISRIRDALYMMESLVDEAELGSVAVGRRLRGLL